MFLDRNFRSRCRIDIRRIDPEVITRTSAGDIGIADTGHHRAEILDLFDKMAWQVGEERFLAWKIMVDIAIDNALDHRSRS